MPRRRAGRAASWRLVAVPVGVVARPGRARRRRTAPPATAPPGGAAGAGRRRRRPRPGAVAGAGPGRLRRARPARRRVRRHARRDRARRPGAPQTRRVRDGALPPRPGPRRRRRPLHVQRVHRRALRRSTPRTSTKGEQYLVGASVDPPAGVLASTIRQPEPLFGGDDVIAAAERDVTCPAIVDPCARCTSTARRSTPACSARCSTPRAGCCGRSCCR